MEYPLNTEPSHRLSKHPSGSLLELLSISLPLMLSFLSGNLMIFLDRLILAKYSLEAMNAASAAAMTCMIFIYGVVSIASIAEVFVGKDNGSGEITRAARPVWQMIWFSLSTFAIFFLIANLGGPFLLSSYYYQEHGLPYFQWLLYFGPIFGMQAAISAFFVGIGRTKIVFVAAVIGNLTNVLLDVILVFGLGVLPKMGAKGAAIATGISQIIQVILLMQTFLKPVYRRKYCTQKYQLYPKVFFRCLRVGIPTSISHIIEISAWAVLARMMIHAGEAYITVIAIGQSFYNLIAFAMEGLQKAVITIASNFIGSQKWQLIVKTWKSALLQLVLLAAVFSIFMIFYPDPIIAQFTGEQSSSKELVQLLKKSCFFVWIFLIFDGIAWIAAGILTACEDTLFIMLMNAVAVWLFGIFPIYYFIIQKQNPPFVVWFFICCYGCLNALCFYLRLKFRLQKILNPSIN